MQFWTYTHIIILTKLAFCQAIRNVLLEKLNSHKTLLQSEEKRHDVNNVVIITGSIELQALKHDK